MSEELLVINNLMHIPFVWSAGPYLGKFLTELRDKGKLWAARCPKCQRLLLPPRMVCGKCHVKVPEFPEGWVELSGKGWLDSWVKIVAPQMDPATGEIKPEPYLHGNFLLDEGVQFSHFLGVIPGAEEESKLKRGMRVEVVMKPMSERTGEITDIKYFRVFWDEPVKDLGKIVDPADE